MKKDTILQNIVKRLIRNTIVNLQGNAQVYGNVFGGGNEGLVEGSSKVNILEHE